MKLIAKKNGGGYISSYTINISLNLAREKNLINEDGSSKEVELKEHENGILIMPISNHPET